MALKGPVESTDFLAGTAHPEPHIGAHPGLIDLDQTRKVASRQIKHW